MVDYRHETKIHISNSGGKKPVEIIIEPWGEGYILIADEYCDIVAWGSGVEAPYFSVIPSEENLSVECINTDDFKVMQDGIELKCGHDRSLPSS